MTECNIDKSQLILYLYNELEEKEKPILKKHLQTCQGCQTEIQDYKKTLNELSSLPSIEPSKLLFIGDDSYKRKNKVISFITYGVIAASFICLAIITYFKLPIHKPTATNQQPVQTTSTQNESFISTYEDTEICSWDNTFTDEIAALQKNAITFTANIKTTPLTSLDESIENIEKNIKSVFAKSND
ncbi:MAG: hypothetical protein V1871_00445 [Planctomycetota bacterium]